VFRILQAQFLSFGLGLVFYGTVAFLVAGDCSHHFDVGVYTTLVCFLIYYFFSIIRSC
jgi:hypothetical protein